MAKPKRLIDHTEDSTRPDNVRRFPQDKTTSPDVPAAARTLIEEVLKHYGRGEGFAHYNLVPLRDLPPDRQALSPTYLREARLLDLIATILIAMASAIGGGVNPTIGLLDYLIARGVVTDEALIADVLSSDALMLGHECYVMGLGYARLGIVRTESRMPLFVPPAVRTPDLIPVPTIIPGIFEHHWVYFRREAGEPLDMVPAYRVTLRDASGLTGFESRTIYTKLSGKRRDFDLADARIVMNDRTRQVVFAPLPFWRYLYKGHRR